jgi:phosphotransacetylase/acyl dehydratase
MKIENRPYDEIAVGDTAELRRLCTADDLYVFANSSGNHNPLHLPRLDGDGDGQPEAVAPSMWVGALISAVLGNRLPGPGTFYTGQVFRFLDRVHAGEEVCVRVTVTAKEPGRIVRLATTVDRIADGVRVLEGEAEVIAPEKKLRFDETDVPGLIVKRHRHFDAIMEKCAGLDPIPTAVIAPESCDALEGALLGMRHDLIRPIFIGDRKKIEAIAAEAGEDISGIEIVDIPDHSAAAARGVAMVHEDRAHALMKGHLHTDELLSHVVKRDGGLRTRHRISHVFVMDVPGLDHLLIITDAAINIAPDLETKADIVQNAIHVALALGIDLPKVGILSAVETVNPRIPSTVDAAALSKMAERGQITGGLVDGPLAMDNAINLQAARTKGLKSLVAGKADILVAPNIESANMMAKELTFAANAEAGGLVVGARVPIILTSRSDDEKARLAACAVAALYQDWRRKQS